MTRLHEFTDKTLALPDLVVGAIDGFIYYFKNPRSK